MKAGAGSPSQPPGAVLVAAPQLPEPDRESGSRRTCDAIQFFLAGGWKVALAIPGRRPHADEEALARLGVEIITHSGEEFDRRIRSAGFSLAWIAFWAVADSLIPRIRARSPETRIIVDSVDLHFLRRGRERFQLGLEPKQLACLAPDYGIDLSRELNVYASADAVVTVSDREASLLVDFLGRRVPVMCWPDGEDLSRLRKPFSERFGILFVGSFRHPPNRDGLKWLCEQVLPRLDRRLRQANPLTVVGHGVDRELQDWIGRISGVNLVGWAPSLEPYLENCRISVVPLRFGAGTKRKLIQSAMAGLPAVSTGVGVEGLELRDGIEVLVADTAQEFADGIESLLEDQRLWEILSRRARRTILRRHHRKWTRNRFQEIVSLALALEPRGRQASVPVDWLQSWLRASYPILCERLRTAVAAVVPTGARVAVVSKGDEGLLRLGSREGGHFPRQPDGSAAGFHPPDSGWALAHLGELFQQGVRYLVFPAGSLWWLTHYRRFGDLLAERCVLLFDEPDTGRIYDLEHLEPGTDWADLESSGTKTDWK